MNEKPNAAPRERKLRWFQYTLRTLLVGMAVVCAACAAAIRIKFLGCYHA